MVNNCVTKYLALYKKNPRYKLEYMKTSRQKLSTTLKVKKFNQFLSILDEFYKYAAVVWSLVRECLNLLEHWFVPPTVCISVATATEAHGYCSIFSRLPCRNDRHNMVSETLN